MSDSTLVWHYTCWLEEIIGDDVIRLATEHVPDPRQHAVWFSKDQRWEGSVFKAVATLGGDRLLTFEELARTNNGVGRIGIEAGPELVNWREYQRRCNLPRPQALGLERVARELATNPNNWLASFAPVPREQWRSIQVWRDHRWCDYVATAVA